MEKRSADASLGKNLETLFDAGSYSGLSDGDLLDRFLDRDRPGSESAFSALVDRHGPMVLGVCRRVLGNGRHAEAEDAFQATFLILAKRGATIRGRYSLGGWLHRVARRASLRAKQQADRRRSRETSEVDPDTISLSSEASGSNFIDRHDLMTVIDEELDRLGESQRRAVVLCCVEGMSHEQAAGILRWPVGTVKSRLGRARDQLRRRLIRRGFAPGIVGPFVSELSGKAFLNVVPSALARTTSQSAFQFVAGSSVTATGAIASAVVSLANQEIATMGMMKWKLLATSLAASTLAVGLAGIALAWSSGPAKPEAPDSAKVTAKPAETKKDDSQITLSAHGLVVDPQGNPIAGARVIIREWASTRGSSNQTPKSIDEIYRGERLKDVLAEARTDARGRFQFQSVIAPSFPKHAEVGQTMFPWDLMVLAPGRGLAWTRLTPANQKSELKIVLDEEAIIRARLVEPGGKPAPGVRVELTQLSRISAEIIQGLRGIREFPELDLHRSSVLPTSITDPNGFFFINGLPRNHYVGLMTVEDSHEAKSFIAAATDRQLSDLPAGARGVGRESQKVHTGEFQVEIKPVDHRLIGRLLFEKDGKPVPGAEVLRGYRLGAKTDNNGLFTIDRIPAGPLELHMHLEKSDAAPLAIRFEVPDEPKVIEKTFNLPQGLIAQGKIMDVSTGQGVSGVSLRYTSRKPRSPQVLTTVYGFVAKTNSDGTYRIVVPAGAGELSLQELPDAYAQKRDPVPGTNEPTSPFLNGHSRAIDGASGQVLDGIDFKLTRGEMLTLRVLDPEGKPVPEAIVKRRESTYVSRADLKTNSDGQFSAAGLDASTRYTFDVYHPTEPWGARFVSPEAKTHQGPMSFDVKLKPLGFATGKVTDEKKKPLPDASLRLTTVVGSSGYTEPMSKGILPDGSFTLDRLIEGVEYDLAIEAPGFAKVENFRFSVKPGKSLSLTEFRLPVFDRPLSGVLVDSKGKPIAGAVVSFQQDFSSAIRYSPNGRRHFQNTDEQGRFELDGLPRGKITLMAYRNPTPPSNNITNMIRVEAEPGQTEIRIELPDANRRLQGIED